MDHHLTLGNDMTNPVVANINMLETIRGIVSKPLRGLEGRGEVA